MDFNKRKFTLSKISGVLAIVLSTLFLVATLIDLIEVLSMFEIIDPGYVILTHVIWFSANLTLLGFGIAARMKPVLRLKKAVMGERKKFIWFYGKFRNKIGISALSIGIFVLCFKMSEVFGLTGSIVGSIAKIVQLVICPGYIAIALLQIATIFIKDARVYDSEYKLITKETSAIEFYASMANNGKIYNRAKYSASKLGGSFAIANGIFILIESIYVLIDAFRNGLAFGVSDWKIFVLDLLIIIAKIALSVTIISCGLSLGDKPTQKVVSTEYYEKGMDREFKWHYGSKLRKIFVMLLSLAIAVVSLVASRSLMSIIHPVVMQFTQLTMALVAVYYLSTAVFMLTVIMCVLALAIPDKKVHKQEANIYNLIAGI